MAILLTFWGTTKLFSRGQHHLTPTSNVQGFSFLYLHQHLLFSILLITAVSVGTDNIELSWLMVLNIFSGAYWAFVYPLEKCSFKSFVHSKIDFLLSLSCKFSLVYSGYWPLIRYMLIVNIISHCISCHLLSVSFNKSFNCNEVQLMFLLLLVSLISYLIICFFWEPKYVNFGFNFYYINHYNSSNCKTITPAFRVRSFISSPPFLLSPHSPSLTCW